MPSAVSRTSLIPPLLPSPYPSLRLCFTSTFCPVPAARSSAKMSIFLLISLAVHGKIYEGSSSGHTYAQTHTQAQAHPQSQSPTVQTAGECNKAPLFLRSIKQNSKDLCESLRVCECVCVAKRQAKAFHAALTHREHRTRDTGHRTRDTGQRTLSRRTDGTFIHLMSTPPLPSSTA